MISLKEKDIDTSQLFNGDGTHMLLGFGPLHFDNNHYKLETYFLKHYNPEAQKKFDSKANFRNKKRESSLETKKFNIGYFPILRPGDLWPGKQGSQIISKRDSIFNIRISIKNLDIKDQFCDTLGKLFDKHSHYFIDVDNKGGLMKSQYVQILKKGIHYDEGINFDQIVVPSYTIFKHFFSSSKIFNNIILHYGLEEDMLIKDSLYVEETDSLIVLINRKLKEYDLDKLGNLLLLREAQTIIKEMSRRLLVDFRNNLKPYIFCRFPEERMEVELSGKICIDDKNSILYVYEILGSKVERKINTKIFWNRYGDSRKANTTNAENKPHGGSQPVGRRRDEQIDISNDEEAFDNNGDDLSIEINNSSNLTTPYNIERLGKMDQQTKAVFVSHLKPKPTKLPNDINCESSDDNFFTNFLEDTEKKLCQQDNEDQLKRTLRFLEKLKGEINNLEIQFINKHGERTASSFNTKILSTFVNYNTKLRLGNSLNWCYSYNKGDKHIGERKVAIIELIIRNNQVYLFETFKRVGYDNEKYCLILVSKNDLSKLSNSEINELLITTAKTYGKWNSHNLTNYKFKKFKHTNTLTKRITQYINNALGVF